MLSKAVISLAAIIITTLESKTMVDDISSPTSPTQNLEQEIMKKVLVFMYKKKWTRLENFIREEECILSLFYYDPMVKSKSSKSSKRQQYNLLHLLCKYNAPKSLISLLIEKNSNLLMQRDKVKRRLPLHIALQYGMSIQTIALMIEKCPESLTQKDRYGYIPLHSACCRQQQNHQFSSSSRHYRYDLIELILNANTRLVLVEDDQERNAIEHALDSKLDRRVIRLLQKVACEVQKQIQKQSFVQMEIREHEHNEETKEDMEISHSSCSRLTMLICRRPKRISLVSFCA